ncbi:MAG: hypothetical protein HOK30_13165 [Rhodospirillaceae bacterium]|nr:hypothetical protein [Rhodospirillaceae bacterium]
MSNATALTDRVEAVPTTAARPLMMTDWVIFDHFEIKPWTATRLPLWGSGM